MLSGRLRCHAGQGHVWQSARRGLSDERCANSGHDCAAEVDDGRDRTTLRPAEFRKDGADTYTEGVASIYDLRTDPVADIRDPYHCLMFYLPRTALNRIAQEAGTPRIGDLRHHAGVSVDDPVVRHLLSALLPAMRKPEEAHALSSITLHSD